MAEMGLRNWVAEQVEDMVLADTHEHLVEEVRRTSPSNDWLLPCDDWSLLFREYIQDDLHSAGMSDAEQARFYDPETASEQKFRLVSPYWERTRHTGYAQALSITIDRLYGVKAFSLPYLDQLAHGYSEFRKPGFYERILKDVCRLSECHVNSLERVFMASAQPELLSQDISIMELSRCSLADIAKVEAELGVEVQSFSDWISAIDTYFERFATRAVAVKYQGAYYRRLDFARVSRTVAEQSFASLVAARPFIGPDGLRALEDYFFHYCLGKAQEYNLPVKLHTGYFATRDSMPLERVRDNAVDVCHLLQSYPSVKFVLMHVGYPYQDECIALCKQYSNAYVDMCWAWIINPAACVRFLSEFLVTVPANKVLTFGGDFIVAENIVGHSVIARRGIAEAVTTLVDRTWIDKSDVPQLLRRLTHLNAEELFPNARGSRFTAR